MRNIGVHVHVAGSQDCEARTARCFEIRCDIEPLSNKQSKVVKLRARLWNHTFVEVRRLSAGPNVI